MGTANPYKRFENLAGRIARAALAAAAALVAGVVLLPLLVLGLPFWGLSVATRLIHRRIVSRKPVATPWQQLVEFEPTVGWKPKPGLRVHAGEDQPFQLTTGPDGWRGAVSLEDADVVVFGDSFAFGYGVDDADFFPRAVRGLTVKTVGTNGYNMVQELLWMERLADELRGKLVVWLVYYGNDLYDNLQPCVERYRQPFVRQGRGGGWEIVTEHVTPEPWPNPAWPAWSRRLAEICSRSFLSTRAFGACEFLIRRGGEACEKVGARLIVLGNPDVDQIDPDRHGWLASLSSDPSSFEPERPDRELAAICARLGVRFEPLSRHLSVADHFPDDCHWTPGGHRRVARVIADLFHAEWNEAASVNRSPGRMASRPALARAAAGEAR